MEPNGWTRRLRSPNGSRRHSDILIRQLNGENQFHSRWYVTLKYVTFKYQRCASSRTLQVCHHHSVLDGTHGKRETCTADFSPLLQLRITSLQTNYQSINPTLKKPRNQKQICRLTFASLSLTSVFPSSPSFPTTVFFKVILHSAPSHNFIYISSPNSLSNKRLSSRRRQGRPCQRGLSVLTKLAHLPHSLPPPPSAAPFVARACVDVIAE